MAGRRKVPPAELRTLSLFSGTTPLEDAAKLLEREAEIGFADEERSDADRSYEGTQSELARVALEWLGLDAFASGDDVTVLVGPQGAVLSLTYAKGTHVPEKTIQVKLSKKQWTKLRKIVRGEP